MNPLVKIEQYHAIGRAFPDRVEHKFVIHRYGILLKAPLESFDSTKQYLDELLTQALGDLANFRGRVREFAIGGTQVYFREGALKHLEAKRNQRADLAATKIQAAVRSFLAKTRVETLQNELEQEEQKCRTKIAVLRKEIIARREKRKELEDFDRSKSRRSVFTEPNISPRKPRTEPVRLEFPLGFSSESVCSKKCSDLILGFEIPDQILCRSKYQLKLVKEAISVIQYLQKQKADYKLSLHTLKKKLIQLHERHEELEQVHASTTNYVDTLKKQNDYLKESNQKLISALALHKHQFAQTQEVQKDLESEKTVRVKCERDLFEIAEMINSNPKTDDDVRKRIATKIAKYHQDQKPHQLAFPHHRDGRGVLPTLRPPSTREVFSVSVV